MKVNSDNMRKMILKLYRDNPNVANSDKLLIASIWADEGWEQGCSIYQNLLKVSSPETIRRTRQKLQQEGLIKASDEVTEERYKEFKQARFSI